MPLSAPAWLSYLASMAFPSPPIPLKHGSPRPSSLPFLSLCLVLILLFCFRCCQACEKYESALRLRPGSHAALYNWGVALTDLACVVKVGPVVKGGKGPRDSETSDTVSCCCLRQ